MPPQGIFSGLQSSTHVNVRAAYTQRGDSMPKIQRLESRVVCVPMSGPGDVSQVAALFDRKEVDPAHVVAVMAQTEGDPYARGYATLAMQVLLSERLAIPRQKVFDSIPFMMISGVGGIMSPHIYLFIKLPATAPAVQNGKRLVFGVASSRELKPEEYGTMVQVDLVAETVKLAMADAGITDASQVECVEVKCPAMTPARQADTERRGQKVVAGNPAVASSLAKGACALGVAVATGEIERGKLKYGMINVEKNLYSSVASTSAGGEQVACRVMVLGNVEGAPGQFVAAHA